MTIETTTISPGSTIGFELVDTGVRALNLADQTVGLDALGLRAIAAVTELVDLEPDDPDAHANGLDSVDAVGRDAQEGAAEHARSLLGRLRQLSLRSWRWPGSLMAIADHSRLGGPVTRSLAELRLEFEKLDPDWAIGGASVGTASVNPYLTRLEQSDGVIDAMIASLGVGRDQLKRDNVALLREQTSLARFEYALADAVALATAMEAALGERLARRRGVDDRQRRFIGDELLVSLRRRTAELREQRAVVATAVLVAGSIFDYNRELIRRFDEAVDTTTAARGMARSLDLDALARPFGDTLDALDEIARCGADSVPRLARSILQVDRLMSGAERSASTKVA